MDDFARAQIEALKRRVEDLEHHLRMVYEHTGLDTAVLVRDEPAVDPEVVEMLRAGRMVQAIKAYRDTHDVDLATAKAEIERIHAEGNY
jgi:hypothetical protein